MKPQIGKNYYVKDDKGCAFEMRCLGVQDERSVMRWNPSGEMHVVHHDRVVAEIPEWSLRKFIRGLFGLKDA